MLFHQKNNLGYEYKRHQVASLHHFSYCQAGDVSSSCGFASRWPAGGRWAGRLQEEAKHFTKCKFLHYTSFLPPSSCLDGTSSKGRLDAPFSCPSAKSSSGTSGSEAERGRGAGLGEQEPGALGLSGWGHAPLGCVTFGLGRGGFLPELLCWRLWGGDLKSLRENSRERRIKRNVSASKSLSEMRLAPPGGACRVYTRSTRRRAWFKTNAPPLITEGDKSSSLAE